MNPTGELVMQLCTVIRCTTCTTYHLYSLRDVWRHFCLSRAAAHSDCCFFGAMYKYSYLLTDNVCTVRCTASMTCTRSTWYLWWDKLLPVTGSPTSTWSRAFDSFLVRQASVVVIHCCVCRCELYDDLWCISAVPFNRQHLSCGDCLGGKRGDYLTSSVTSVLLCIIIVHIICTPIQWAVCTRSTGSGFDLAWLNPWIPKSRDGFRQMVA